MTLHCDPYWFADHDEDATPPYVWSPFLETGDGMVPSIGVWFQTEQECDEWIDRFIVGAGRETP